MPFKLTSKTFPPYICMQAFCLAILLKLNYMQNSRSMENEERALPLFREITSAKRENGSYYTAANYESFISKLTQFLGKKRELFSLHEINKKWVEDYIQWLHEKHPRKPQTVDFYFRGLRALYNKAIEKTGSAKTLAMDPFFGLRVKKTAIPKRALSCETLQRLLDPSLKTCLNEKWTKALDVLLFSLYCRGMVFHDIYDLTWEMIANDWQMQYCRSKTGQHILLTIPPEGREIMRRYRQEDNPYVFPFLRETRNGRLLSEKSSLRRVNRHLNEIGRALDIPYKLTTYVIRHTWATLMLEAGKPVEVISQCMGHTSIKTTQIYLSSISTAKIDEDVDDMLNCLVRPYRHKKR